MKKTIKELVESIPGRLGFEVDLSTPEKAVDFLSDKEFAFFYKQNGSNCFYDTVDPDSDIFVTCGRRAMYEFNRIFAPDYKINEEDTKKYGKIPMDMPIEFLLEDYADDIAYLEDISFYEETDYKYMAAIFKDFSDYNTFLNIIKKICKETKDTVEITNIRCKDYSTEHYNDIQIGMLIDADGNVKSCGKFNVCDDNGWKFATGIIQILSGFTCSTFDEFENLGIDYEVVDAEKTEISRDSGLMFAYKNAEKLKNITDVHEAVKFIEKFPLTLKYMPLEVQKDKTVALSFIKANTPYMEKYNEIERGHYANIYGSFARLSGLIDRDASALQLYGIVPCGEWATVSIDNDVIFSWEKDIDIFKTIIKSPMYKWVDLRKMVFEKADHIEMIENSPNYIFHLRKYFYGRLSGAMSNKERKAAVLHIKRKYNLSNKVELHEIATVMAYDLLKDIYPDAVSILSRYFNSPEVAVLLKGLLEILPEEKRNELIKKNIHLAYPIRNEIENDDPIVDYICENCSHPGDFLSDEIVELRGLKRSNLNIYEVCEDCNEC